MSPMPHLRLASCASTFPALVRVVLALPIGFYSAQALAADNAPAQERVVMPPQALSHVDAIYPAEAMRARRDGLVVLFVTIDANGLVEDVSVSQSAGKTFDDAAVAAIRQWKFAPARRGETPVRARIRVPFHFAPPRDATPAPIAASPPPQTPPPPPREPISETIEAPGLTGGVSTTHEDVHREMHGHEHHEHSGPALTQASPTQEPLTTTQPTNVMIIGRAQSPQRGASDFHIDVGALRSVPRKNAGDMLKLAPGILLTNKGGEGHAEQVFLRGFDAREGQDIEFSVGGVPINEAGNLHGNGHADLHFIIPELVHSLRVIEGPFDPRQGNFAVAGSADYELALTKRGLSAKYTRGSFGTDRMVLLWGPAQQSTRTFGGAEIYKTDGYGKNRDAQRASAMGQYEGKVGEKGSFRIIGQAYAAEYHSAGVIRDDDYRDGRLGFFDTYDPKQGGSSARYSIAGDIETRDGSTVYRNQVFLINRSMRLRENFTGFLLDSQQPLQHPHPQRGDAIDLSVSSLTLGSRSSAKVLGNFLGHGQELEFGAFARGDMGTGTQLRVQASNQVPYSREVDNEYRLGDIGLYADANLRPLDWMVLRGGIRADLFTFDVLDKCASQSVRQPSRDRPPGDASCLDQQDFGRYRDPTQRASTANAAILPRGSILLGPFKNITFNVSYGQGVRSIDPIYISQDIRTPFSRIAAYEGGVAYAGGLGDTQVVARSVFFRTHVERDLIFSETAGRNTLANGTNRSGWVGALRFTGPWFDQSANLTLVRSAFDDTGLLVPYVPDVVVRSDSAVHGSLPIRLLDSPLRGSLGAGLTYVGRRPLPYGQRSDVVFTIDVGGSLLWKDLEMSLTVNNVLDHRYRLGEYNYASDFQSSTQPTLVPTRHFSAGPPRSIFLSLGATFGGNP